LIRAVDRLDQKIFGTLFFAIFATATGVGIVVPLLPVFALHAGASGFAIGLIFGSFSISRTLFLPYFGRRSDRHGRKRLIVGGLFAYALVSALFMTTSSIAGLILLRFLQGIASAALMPVIQAYVGDITPTGREGLTLGFFNLSLFLGLSLGPLIGGGVHDAWGLEAAFGLMGLLTLSGGLLSLILLPPRTAEWIRRPPQPPGSWRSLVLTRDTLGLILFRFGYTFGIGIIWSFLPVLADAEYGLSATAIGSLIMLGVLFSGVLQIPLGHLADRVDKRRMVAMGGLVVALALAGFECSGGYAGLAAANLLFGLGGGASMAAHMAQTVQKGGRMKAMGSLIGILTAAHSLGMMAGALVSGLMMDLCGPRTVFPTGAAVMLGCTLASFAAGRKQPVGAAAID
jgi:DHA1 family multidrug resistance protein-like MFS transporter